MYYVNNWIYTTNHKRIAVNYFWFVILSGIVGMVLATIIRLEFAYPGVGVFAGDSIQYLSLASAHGVIMVFFMIMPLLFGAFANFLLPTQLGVHDVAFPRLNSAAFWFLPGGLLMLCQLVCVDRRYQRMNCFNIREVQSLLKRKFFIDLLNTHDAHFLLNKTTLGLRYKLNNIESVNSNVFIFFNFGLHANSSIRDQIFINNSASIVSSLPLLKWHFFFFIEKLIQFNILNLINSIFFIFLYYFDISVKLSYRGTSFVSNALMIFSQALRQVYTDFTYISSQAHDFFFAQLDARDTRLTIYTILESFFLFCKMFVINDTKNLFFFFNSKIENGDSLPIILRKIITDLWIHITFLKYYLFYSNNVITENLNVFDYFFNFLNYVNAFGIVTKFSTHEAFVAYDYFFCNTNFYEWAARNLRVVYFNIDTRSNFSGLTVNNQNALKAIFDSLEYEANRSFNTLFRLNSFNTIIPFSGILQITAKQLNDEINNADSIVITNANNVMFFLNINFIFFLFQNSVNLLELGRDYLFSYKMVFEVFFFFFNFFFFNFFFFFINNNFFFYLNNFLFDLLFVYEGIFSKAVSDISVSSLIGFNYGDFWIDVQNKISSKSTVVRTLADFFFFVNFLIAFCLKNVYEFCSVLLRLITILFFDLQTSKIFSFFYYLFSISPFSNLFEKFSVSRFSPQLMYKSNFLIQTNEIDRFATRNQESSNTSKFKRFDDIVFKYDYKAGDYFPKLNKEVYPFLFASIINLTSGLRTSPWFFSQNFIDLINTIWETAPYHKYRSFETTTQKWSSLAQNQLNKNLSINGFYNFFCILSQTTVLNNQWLSFNSLNQKFYRMFTTSSMQQRIYGNWRQLKFSREAWRCKLLTARHQKTLFKRYLNEDGVFWSIERNAKDLIPGWAMITPFSSRTRFTAIGKTDIGLMGVLLVLNSSIISGANFIVTYRYLSTLNNRKIRDARAFFTEAVLTASWMMILANPMLSIGIIMLLSDRHWQTSFFDYSGGGDTVLFQHMFWFFGHPEVYVIIIPTFGFTNTMLSFYLRKRISARASLLYSLYTIAFLGFFVWGHHMYMVGLAHTTRMLFSTLTVMISVPAATKIMHWCVTTVNSSFAMELPLLFTFTFIFLFVSGGISGMCVAHTGMDILFHDTFYVIGHFHVMLAGGAMFASFGAFYFYFPAIFGVKFSRIYAYLHYTYYLIGQLMTVIPMFWLGYAGMPRRVLDYPASFGGWHSVISAGHLLNVAGLMAFFIMIFDSLRQGRAATRNTFGINRYNVRLNFYLYEIAKLNFIDQKALFLYNHLHAITLIPETPQCINFETYETTLLSYSFIKN